MPESLYTLGFSVTKINRAAAAIKTRFFNISKHPARARTLTFAADPEQMERLGDEMILDLRRKCIEAEEKGLLDEDVISKLEKLFKKTKTIARALSLHFGQ